MRDLWAEFNLINKDILTCRKQNDGRGNQNLREAKDKSTQNPYFLNFKME